MSESAPRRAAEQQLLACRDRLLARIRWMTGDRARRDAESQDFLGEVVARILTDADKLTWRDDEHFLALATRIARNLIVDRVRRPRVQRFDSFTHSVAGLAEAGGPSPSAAAADDEAVERALQALEQLDADHQRVIELRDFEDLPFTEVGGRMNRSAAAAQMLHGRAVLALGRVLRQ